MFSKLGNTDVDTWTDSDFEEWAKGLRERSKQMVAPFDDESEELRKERTERAEKDRLFFFKTYFPHYFEKGFGEIHWEWDSFLDARNEAFIIIAPREHAKSTLFTFGSILHDIAFRTFPFICILSDTQKQARKFTLPIRAELEANKRFIYDFGDIVGFPWTKEEYTTTSDVTIMGASREQNIRGIKAGPYRLRKVVIDDWDNRKKVKKNPEYVSDGVEFLKEDVLGTLGNDFLFLMLGNRISNQSAISQMSEEVDERTGEPRYRSYEYRAILDYDTASAKPLWPENWSMERLENKRRLMGTKSFNRDMMNLVEDDESHFPRNWFQYYEPAEIEEKNFETVRFTDPSGNKSEGNDFRAVVTVSLCRDDMTFYVRHAWIRNESLNSMFDAIYKQESIYGGRDGIEENMYKEFLRLVVISIAEKKGKFLKWKLVNHSTNKLGRIIATLQVLVEFGKIKFIRGHSDQDRLIDQLVYLHIPSFKDDGPDALEGAVSLLNTRSGGVRIRTGMPRRMPTILKGFR